MTPALPTSRPTSLPYWRTLPGGWVFLALTACGPAESTPSPERAPSPAAHVVRLDPASAGASEWTFQGSWFEGSIEPILSAVPPIWSCNAVSAESDPCSAGPDGTIEGLPGWVALESPSAMGLPAGAAPSAELTRGPDGVSFGPGFGALGIAVPVHPRTHYVMTVRLRKPASTSKIFSGPTVVSLGIPAPDSLSRESLGALLTSPRTFRDQLFGTEELNDSVRPLDDVAAVVHEGDGFERWTLHLAPTMFETRTLLVGLIQGLAPEGGHATQPFSVREVALYEVPARHGLRWTQAGAPLSGLPDVHAVDVERRMALVRRDEVARRSLLFARGSSATVQFPAPPRDATLDLALTALPEARLSRATPPPSESLHWLLRRADGTEIARGTETSAQDETTPHFWTTRRVDVPAGDGDYTLELQHQGVDAPDSPLLALAVPRINVPAADATPPRPNLLVVSLDTLRADRLGKQVDGRSLTPHLDALAARSTRYRNAFSTSSYTLPAHVSLFTGQYPDEHGMLHPTRRLSATKSPTSTQALAAAGYRTAAFTASAMLNAEFCGLHRGFDFYGETDPMISETDPLPVKVPRWDAPEYNAAVFEARSLGNAVLPWLETQGDVPWFAFVHTYLVHNYHPGAPFRKQFERRPTVAPGQLPDGAGPALWERDDGSTGVTPTSLTRLDPTNPASFVPVRDLPYLESLYDATVARADAEVGRILETLEASGQLDHTVILIVSDHGEEFLEHDGLGHARTLYDEMIRVPAILYRPGVAPCVIDEPVDLVDLASTLLGALDIESPSTFRGTDLTRDTADDVTRHQGLLGTQSDERILRAARTPQWKWIVETEGLPSEGSIPVGDVEAAQLQALGYLPDSDTPSPTTSETASTPSRRELYHLQNDPVESRDLSDDEDAINAAQTIEAHLLPSNGSSP